MTNNHEHEFKNVINSLKLLREVKASQDFRKRMEMKLQTPKPYAMPFFALRIALVVFLVLMSGTGVVTVASQSTPGEALYPVKQIVDSVKTNFTPPTEISKMPTAEPQKQSEEKVPANKTKYVSPTPSAPVQQQTFPVSEEQHDVQPTPTPSSSPTPTPIIQGVLPAVHDTVNTALPIVLPIGGSSEPTPTPQPTIEGSKDNGSDAGAGGSLLPKIKIGPILQ